VVGRSYAYQTMSSVKVLYDESVNINPFMRSGACGTVIADFVSDNFDHGPLGFVGGTYIGEVMTNGRPIEFHPTPPGTPAWGGEWKRAAVCHYNHSSVLSVHGSSVAVKSNYLDLDPTYKDALSLSRGTAPRISRFRLEGLERRYAQDRSESADERDRPSAQR